MRLASATLIFLVPVVWPTWRGASVRTTVGPVVLFPPLCSVFPRSGGSTPAGSGAVTTGIAVSFFSLGGATVIATATDKCVG